jgi:type III secretion protein C
MKTSPFPIGVTVLVRAACAALCLLVAPVGAIGGTRVPAPRPQGEASSPHVPVGGLSWNVNHFTYEADGKRLSEVLQDFAAVEGLPAIIADGIDGVVHGTFDTAPEAFLDAMAKTYGVIWYHDGSSLYFYPAKAAQSKLFHLKGYSRQQVEQLLTSLNLGDSRFPLRYNKHSKTLMAYGPPRHLEIVAQALDALDNGLQESNATVVRVFPLRYATASDRTLGNTNVPGLVTALRGIYGDNNANSAGKVMPDANNASMFTKMQAMRSVSDGHEPSSANASTQIAAGEAPSAGSGQRGFRPPADDQDTPHFEADGATNSVVVRGRQQHMSEYEYLIRRLDRRPMLVELEATIIDVDADSVQGLGIDWGFGSSKGLVTASGSGGSSQDSVLSGAGGYAMSTLWGNAGRALLARVHVLQSKNEARIIAKPRVLGVVNRPAVMSQTYSASVRVSGNQDAQLFNVEVGTKLEVTPQTSDENGVTRLKLGINIQDGQFDSRVVDNVPVVKHSEIRTEAHVVEGESLLIGGISVDTNATGEEGVPVLSRIPVLGALFRKTGEHKSRSERLFLITPRLVRDIDHLPSTDELDAVAAADAAASSADGPASSASSQSLPAPDASQH